MVTPLKRLIVVSLAPLTSLAPVAAQADWSKVFRSPMQDAQSKSFAWARKHGQRLAMLLPIYTL
jgi:hypothetical protein